MVMIQMATMNFGLGYDINNNSKILITTIRAILFLGDSSVYYKDFYIRESFRDKMT